MAGARASGSTTKARGPRGAAGARTKGTPAGGWQFADLSDAGQRASYERQLAARGKDVDAGLEQVRRIQRSQPDSGGFASDDPEPPPALPPAGGGPAGGKPKAKPTPGPQISSPTLTPPSKLSAADGGGFLLGLVLFAIGQSYIRYGTAGVTGWFAAKFLNRPPANLIAAEGKRGIVAKQHGTLTSPGAPSTPPSFLTGKPPTGTPQVPPGGRFGR